METYKKVQSVLMGKDNEALTALFDMHFPTVGKVLDCTHNRGAMWEGLAIRPVRGDICLDFCQDVRMDFSAMPFGDSEFDVIVFDPPHLPTHAASANSSMMWKRRYGITENGNGREGDHVCGMFAPFLLEAKRVLRPGGLVFAKIADLTHNHRYQWQHVEFINKVQELDMTACDMLIKCDPLAGRLASSKWKNAHHFRKAHVYWIVVRNSLRCEI